MTKKWNVGWGPISSCNMKCAFCYSKGKRNNSRDLELKDWIRFVDQNSDHINTINYGTGENTLSSDWFALVDYIRTNFPNIRQSLTTNGHLSAAVHNDASKMKIFESSIDEVDVSLDFPSAEKHNAFRGQQQAFQWALETLKLCKKINKPSTIVFLGSKSNVSKEQIDGLFRLARENGAILRMNLYRPTEGINEHSAKFLLSYEEVVKVLSYISEKYKILALNDALFSSILTGDTIDDPSGERSIRILSDGSITPSTYLISDDYLVGNILDGDVLSQLEKNNSTWNILHKHVPPECQGCVFSQTCAGGVFDRRFLWHGTLDKKDPYCPGIFTIKPDDKLDICSDHFVSVHDGYLPTLFFKP